MTVGEFGYADGIEGTVDIAIHRLSPSPSECKRLVRILADTHGYSRILMLACNARPTGGQQSGTNTRGNIRNFL
eukprot:665637-Hanusia_phi.AAC.4